MEITIETLEQHARDLRAAEAAIKQADIAELETDSDPFDEIRMGMREQLEKELFQDEDTYILDSIKSGNCTFLELDALKALMITVKDSAAKLEAAIEAYTPANLEPIDFASGFTESELAEALGITPAGSEEEK